MVNRVTIEDLLKRKKSFFVSYEVNVDTWNAKDFDKDVDFFDLEDMLASRYWLKRLEREGKLTAAELRELHNLEKKFHELGIPEFVKKYFPGVYEKWIANLEMITAIPINIADILTEIVNNELPVKLRREGERNESEEIQQIAA